MARFSGTSKVLEANETFTSDTLNISGDDMVRGVVVSDQAGTLVTEFSVDGKTWKPQKTISTVAGTPSTFATIPYTPWLRFRFTNGGTAQNSFSLSVRVYDPQKGEYSSSRGLLRGGVFDANGDFVGNATINVILAADGSFDHIEVETA